MAHWRCSAIGLVVAGGFEDGARLDLDPAARGIAVGGYVAEAARHVAVVYRALTILRRPRGAATRGAGTNDCDEGPGPRRLRYLAAHPD